MLPHPARPAEPDESVEPPAARRGNGARGGTSGTRTPAFVPPLAPSPPPETPPTVHTRPEADANNLSQSICAGSAEHESESPQPGSFGSILHGEANSDSSGRAYHLRGPSNPVRAVQRLVRGRAVKESDPQESDPQDTQEDIGARDENPPEPVQSEHTPEPDHTRADTIRRTVVTATTVAALGTVYVLTRSSSGWPQIDHASGDVLDPAASLLGTYPWIWLAWIPVLAGAAAYALWQWLPAQRTNPRQVWTGPISSGSAAVAALWLWAVQAGNPAAAFWLSALGVGIGLAAIHLSNTWAAESRSDTVAADSPAAVFLGTSTIALLSGLGTWLTSIEADVAGWGPAPWALIAIVAVVIGTTTVAMTDRGHLAAALTVVAGLTAIGFARLLTEQGSVPAAAGAFVGAFLILVSAGSRRHQVDHAERRRQRDWLTAEASVPAAGEAPEAVRT